MAKTPQKKTKKPQPKPKQHLLQSVLVDLVDQVTIIADTIKSRAVPTSFDEEIPPPSPTPLVTSEEVPIAPPVSPGPPPSDPPVSPPPPPLAECCDDEFCTFLKTSPRPLVKAYPTWDPSKAVGSRWEWMAE